MRSGTAPIAELSTLSSFLDRRYRLRRLGGGVLVAVTALFWGMWIYLAMPLLSLLLWTFGMRLYYRQMVELGGHEALLHSLAGYSLVLLGIGCALALWIVWNLRRYGGARDRRHRARPPAPGPDVAALFQLSPERLHELRSGKVMRLDFDAEGGVRITDCRPTFAPQLLR